MSAFSALGSRLVQPLGKPCACYHGPCDCGHMQTVPVAFGRPCSLGVPHPLWLLRSFCLLFHRVPWGVDLREMSPLRLNAPRSLTLCTFLSCGSWCFVYCRREFLCWWLSKALISEHSRMSPRVLWLPSVFSRTGEFIFYSLSPWPVCSQVLGHPSCIGNVFRPMEWALNPIGCSLITPF